MNSTHVIGINVSHNPAAVLINQNGIICAFEEEKIRQVKGLHGWPTLSIEKCLSRLPKDESISIVAIGCENISEFLVTNRNLIRTANNSQNKNRKYILFDLVKFIFPSYNLEKSLRGNVFRIISNTIGYEVELRFVNHHFAHAASAAFVVDWENALVVTEDGKGDFQSGSVYLKRRDTFTLVNLKSYLRSLGQVYAMTTEILGFKSNRHEGKITGLAAFGNPKSVSARLRRDLLTGDTIDFEKIAISEIKPKTEKLMNRFNVRGRWLHLKRSRLETDVHRNYELNADRIRGLLQSYKNDGISNQDIAAGVQEFCEQQVVNHVKQELITHKENRICLAGGLFANVKINQALKDNTDVSDIFVQPAMDDAGTALGAALVALTEKDLKLSFKNSTINQVYLGEEFSREEIVHELKQFGLSPIEFRDTADVASQLLAKNYILGMFSGRSEWGPRALGNRSILCSGTVQEITAVLNNRLNRSDFMPFAPIVMEEDVQNIFEDFESPPIAAEFMTITAKVRREIIEKFPAIVHVDGTARPQILKKQTNYGLWQILNSYREKTGFGLLINTSFNLHEFPIVFSPRDAIVTFLSGAVDVLVFENLFVFNNPNIMHEIS